MPRIIKAEPVCSADAVYPKLDYSYNLGDDAGANGAATLADREAQTSVFHGDWGDQLNSRT